MIRPEKSNISTGSGRDNIIVVMILLVSSHIFCLRCCASQSSCEQEGRSARGSVRARFAAGGSSLDCEIERGNIEKTREPKLLPRAKEVVVRRGSFNLNGSVPFNVLDGSDGLDEASIRLAVGGNLKLDAEASVQLPQRGLRLIVDCQAVGKGPKEAYKLEVESERITITGRSSAGVLMGLRTLAQLATESSIPQCEITDWPDMSLRAAHLCYAHIRETMAYNVPNFDALMDQIDRLAALKYNAVLLELTAMFPYKKHPAIPCKIAFTPEQIQAIRRRLRLHRMEVIPLIQSFGHVYYVLMHDEYFSYRETADKTQQYCPTNPKCTELFLEFVDEYREAFGELRQLHIGGDESRQMGWCPRCKAKVKQLGMHRLYSDHMNRVVEGLHKRGITPLLWSDGLEHWPKAIELMPKYVKPVYWNYDLPKWPRPYFADKLIEAGFDIVGCPAVRFGSSGTELSVFYEHSMRGIEMLVPKLHAEGCREIIVSNWMKGSPHELTDYGFAYNADLCWDVSVTREDFNRRYAQVTFGLDDADICRAYYELSLPLPYAEPVQKHLVDRLDRLDISGLRFPEKWRRYTDDDDEERKVIEQLKGGLKAATKTEKLLTRLGPLVARGKRQFQVLKLAAECIKAKSRFGLALHEGNRLAESEQDAEVLLEWCAKLPSALGEWKAAKQDHHRMLSETGFQPAIDLLSELMFEPAEYDFLVKTGNRVAAKVAHGKKPSEAAIQFLDNRGPAYERGLEHGRIFREQIRGSFNHWCSNRISKATPFNMAVKDKMKAYVADNFPEIVQELQGIADGAGLTLDEVFWLNVFNSVFKINPRASCSNAVLKGADESLWLGTTADIDKAQRQVMLLRRVRDGDRDFYVVGWVGTVWVEMALTRSGLAIGTASAPAQPGQDGYGMGQHFGAYPILFRADNVEQAISEFSKIRFAGKGIIFGLADASGNAAIVEKSGTAQSVIKLEAEQDGILGTNDFLSPAMRGYNANTSQKLIENCERRRGCFTEWLPTAKGMAPSQAIKELFSLEPFCQRGQCNLYTEAAVISSPTDGTMEVTGLPPSWYIYQKWTFADED